MVYKKLEYYIVLYTRYASIGIEVMRPFRKSGTCLVVNNMVYKKLEYHIVLYIR